MESVYLNQDKNWEMEELASEKAKAASSMRKAEEMEKKLQDLQDMLEILTLDKETLEMDKEIAEERAEELQTELDQLKRHQQSEATSSTGDKNVSEENDKLRHAIKSLHDQYSEEKTQMTKQIRSLEKKVASLEPLEAVVLDLKETDKKKQQEIDELKDMLDVANAYESMVEDLTEKNLILGDKVVELEASIATLESLRDMSDEMEEQHVEYEAELRSTIEAKEILLDELQTKIATQKTELDDKESTIRQFRDLTQRNRTEIATLRSQMSSEESQLAELRTQTHDTINKNLSMRVNITNARKRETELALKTLQLQEARVEMEFWREYIPPSIQTLSHDNIQAHLRVLAVQFKAKYLLNQLEQILFQPMSTEDLVQDQRAKVYQYSMTDALCWTIRTAALDLATLESRATAKEEFSTTCRQCIARYTSLNAACDTVLALVAEEGTVRKDSCNNLLSLVASWKKEIESTNWKNSQINVKTQCHFTASLMSIRSQHMLQLVLPICTHLETTVPSLAGLKLKLTELAQVTKSMYQRVENDFGPSETDHEGVLTTGGPTTTNLVQRYLNVSSDILDRFIMVCGPESELVNAIDGPSTSVEDFDETIIEKVEDLVNELRDTMKSMAKGVLMDEITMDKSTELMDKAVIAPSKQLAVKFQSDLLSASTLEARYQEALDQTSALMEKVRELEGDERKFSIVREKMSKDLERLSEKLMETENQMKEMKEKLVREREEFDATLDTVHQEKDAVQNENRLLKRQMKKMDGSSRRSLDTMAPGVMEDPSLNSVSIEALRLRLSRSREIIKSLRKKLYTQQAQEVATCVDVVAVRSEADEKKLMICGKELNHLADQIQQHTFLPTLVSLNCPENPPEQQLLQHQLVKDRLLAKYHTLKREIETLYAETHPNQKAMSSFGDQSYLLPECTRVESIDTSVRIGKLEIPILTASAAPLPLHLSHLSQLLELQNAVFSY